MNIRKIWICFGIAAAILAVWAIPQIDSYIYHDTVRHRALPNMMALAASVEQFQRDRGRLPSPVEFTELRPDSHFRVSFGTSSPETQPSFTHPEDRAGEVNDPYNHPFIYEVTGDTFVIRSLGPDGVPSSDDYVYPPKKN